MNINQIKTLVALLGFIPKENASNIFTKSYQNGAVIEVDLQKEKILFDKKIRKESETTSNFSQAENFVVLECVNRLLETGYKAENIILEKTWKLGHNEKGRLDILVTKTDPETKEETAFAMIECKTAGKEFEKELKNMHTNGGQLFSYFQQNTSAEILMLYASELKGEKISYKNEIIKIEEDYRSASTVIDLFNKWNKITKPNGLFENPPYNFRPKTLKITDLKDIQPEESGYIFNRFLEILRHNVVSDKPNAFNKIFNLFLCKIYDEKSKEGTDQELGFQWKEGIDGSDYVDFQIRLTDLYKEGMYEFLEKKVTDFTEKELEKEFTDILPEGVFHNLSATAKEQLKKRIIYKLRLEKNNEFAIKEVFDGESALENAKVVKEIVELLQGYKLRYTKKQQYLSDFFELLLTTGLKQEAGQFFTPVPVAQFIIKSIPLDKLITEKLSKQKMSDYLPYIIDYAAGSGHFVTESMHEIQKYLNALDIDELKYNTVTKNFIRQAQNFHFDWALEYIYGIEKDYRLVKVGKVGCYLHGDGLANVIHSDGLANFSHKDYKGKLRETEGSRDNKQFDMIVSNPPYSVEAFKNVSTDYYTEADFELYDYLTDQSSEIEVLFVERTKQLLKDGGCAGIILPSSILSNTGIYTKAREIILRYFEIIAITELGSNTFMATGTNTVVLFLRRRTNYEASNLSQQIENIFTTPQDVTLGGHENALSKYIAHVWDAIAMDDYISLLQKTPNENIEKQDLYKEYRKKLRTIPKKDTPETQAKAERDFWEKLLKIEQEKFLYFLLTFEKKVVLVNSGQKDEEKRFLGYEFSNRRGSEGIHPIQKGKKADGTPLTISDCTKLFDENAWENPEKASTYVYKAFLGEYPEIHTSLQNHISHAHLHDMLTFDRVEFDKLVSTSVKKKVVFESKWELVKLGEIISVLESGKRPKGGVNHYQEGMPSIGGEHIGLNGSVLEKNIKFVPAEYFANAKQGIIQDLDILICKDGALTGKVALFKQQDFNFPQVMINEHVFLLRTNSKAIQQFLFQIIFAENGQKLLKENITGTAQGGLNRANLLNIKIPLPPLSVQQEIVSEIEKLETQEQKAKNEIERLKAEIGEIMRENVESKNWELVKIANIGEIYAGGDLHKLDYQKEKTEKYKYPIYSNGKEKEPYGYSTIFQYPTNSITVSGRGNIGDAHLRNEQFCAIVRLIVIIPNQSVVPRFAELSINKIKFENGGVTIPQLTVPKISNYTFPLPPLEIQQKIVSEIEKLETRISELEKELKELPKMKEEILKRYL